MFKTSYKAAVWWADQLKRTDVKKYDVSKEPCITAMLNCMMQSRVTDKQYERFVSECISLIDEKLKKSDIVTLSSGVYPCEELENIANGVGIMGINFPWQVKMYISTNQLYVIDEKTKEKIELI